VQQQLVLVFQLLEQLVQQQVLAQMQQLHRR
jgi:hypothetical protein